MNKISTILFAVLFAAPMYAQVETPEEAEEQEEVEVVEEMEEVESEPDTTTMNIGNTEIIIIDHGDEEDEFEIKFMLQFKLAQTGERFSF